MAHKNIQERAREELWRGFAAGHTRGYHSPLDKPDDVRSFRAALASIGWWPSGPIQVSAESPPRGLRVLPFGAIQLVLWSGELKACKPRRETVAIENLWDGRVGRTTKGPFLVSPELTEVRDRVPPEAEQRQLVSFDSTVWHLGLSAERFRPTDYLVASHGVALDVEYSPVKLSDDGGGERKYESTGRPLDQWDWEEIPTSDLFRAEHREVRLSYRDGTPEQRALLSLGDLVCAATASLYGIPLYTVKPEAYKFLKLGIKTLKYGSVRNPDIVVGKRPRPLPIPEIIPRPIPESERTPVPSENQPALSPAEQLLAYQDAGNDFDETASQLLAALATDPAALASVGDALLPIDGPVAFDWQRGFLEVALRADVTSAAQNHRTQVVQLLENASAGAYDYGNPERQEVGRLAIDAIGEWDTLGPQFNDLLGDFDEDEDSHIWYRALLRLHGVSREATQAELTAVEQGTSTPSLDRIHTLAAQETDK